jgi:PH (Pleckstrin Homology) domain-containing protein
VRPHGELRRPHDTALPAPTRAYRKGQNGRQPHDPDRASQWRQPWYPPRPVMENMPRVDAVRWYRARGARITVIVWSLNVIILAVASVQLGSEIPAALSLVAGAVVECCAWFAFGVLLWRSGIGVAADRIIVRNAAGRQQLIPWPSVAGFDLGPPKYWLGGLVVYVVCDDGRRLYTRGCSFQGLSSKKDLASARRMLRLLRWNANPASALYASKPVAPRVSPVSPDSV